MNVCRADLNPGFKIASNNMNSVPDLAEDPDEARLLSWYQNVHVQRFDLVGDYAGNELFMIEGDSMLLHCFSTSKVDFDGKFFARAQ